MNDIATTIREVKNASVVDGFHFDEEKHLYTKNKTPLRNVTGCITGSGLLDTTFMTEEGRTRGQHVHTAVAYYVQGDLDYGSVAPWIWPYVDAYKEFRSDLAIEVIPELCEIAAMHPVWWYGGKWDQIAIRRGRWILIDIKTGNLSPTTAVQLAAYANLPPLEALDVERYALRLDPKLTPPYRWKKYDDPTDFQTFLAALTVTNWKRRHNIREAA